MKSRWAFRLTNLSTCLTSRTYITKYTSWSNKEYLPPPTSVSSWETISSYWVQAGGGEWEEDLISLFIIAMYLKSKTNSIVFLAD